MTMQSERRSRRSENPAEAMRFYLQSVAERFSAGAVVVADEHGFLISGTGAPQEMLKELAALSSLGKLKPREMEVEQGRFCAQQLSIDSDTIFVGTMGGNPVPEQEVSNAVTRILLF